MKKKRKIQIPAAAYGIGTNYETQLLGTDYVGLLKQQGDAYTRMNNFQLGMAKKDTNAATNFTESLNANDNQFFSDLKGKYGNAGKSVGSTGNPIVDNAGALGEATFNAVGGLMDQFGTKSTAQTGKEVWMQSITDIGTQAANGYNIGKHFGPIGAAGGAIIGAAVGAVGRKGEAPSYDSFTSGSKGSRPTGAIAVLGGTRKYKRQLENFERNINNNKAAVQGTNYLQNEAYDDLLGMNASASAYGGVPTSMFFGDAGEWMRTEDGEFHKIPEDHSKTDSKLIQADGKVQVLSDALKVGGKTPAKWFDEMATTKKSKFNDIYALNAAKLNKMNNNMIFDLLFALQESIKQLKGIKPKTKQLIPAAAGGATVGEDSRHNTFSVNGKRYRLGERFEYKGKTYEVTGTNKAIPVQNTTLQDATVLTSNLEPWVHTPALPSWNKPVNQLPEVVITAPSKNKVSSRHNTFEVAGKRYNLGETFNYKGRTYKVTGTNEATPVYDTTDWQYDTNGKVYPIANDMFKPHHPYYFEYDEKPLTEEMVSPNAEAFFSQLKPASQTAQATPAATGTEFSVVPADSYSLSTTSTPAAATAASTSPTRKGGKKAVVSKPTTKAAATQQKAAAAQQVVAPEVETVIDEDLLDLNFRPDLQPVMGYTPEIKKPTAATTDNGSGSDTGRGSRFDWGSLASKAAALAPILSNLMATPEIVLPNYNPYETAILNTMRRRRYDVSSAIEDLNRNRAISNYNASQFNTSTGANLAYRLQSAVNTDRAIANLRTMENNYNNQYLGDYANMSNNLGQQRVTADNLNDDLNAQNRAAAGNIVSTGKGQLSGFVQNNYLMSELEKRDRMYWPYYREFLKNGFTNDVIDGVTKNNARKIKRQGGNKNGSKLV